jgi:hypothetical protein
VGVVALAAEYMCIEHWEVVAIVAAVGLSSRLGRYATGPIALRWSFGSIQSVTDACQAPVTTNQVHWCCSLCKK